MVLHIQFAIYFARTKDIVLSSWQMIPPLVLQYVTQKKEESIGYTSYVTVARYKSKPQMNSARKTIGIYGIKKHNNCLIPELFETRLSLLKFMAFYLDHVAYSK